MVSVLEFNLDFYYSIVGSELFSVMNLDDKLLIPLSFIIFLPKVISGLLD